MEFNKYEKRLLDPRFPARNRVILIIGISSIAMSVMVLVFGGRITEGVRKPYRDMLSDTQKIVTQSQREEIMKQSLFETVKAAELGWYKYAESVRQNIFVFVLFFIFGVVLIVICRQNICVYRLLKKLNISF